MGIRRSDDTHGTHRTDATRAGEACSVVPIFTRAKMQSTSTQLHVSDHAYSLSPQDQGMSGRSLRRLPVLAQARYIGLGFVPTPASVSSTIKPSTNGTPSKNGPVTGNHSLGTSVEVWLNAMERVIDNSSVERKRLEN